MDISTIIFAIVAVIILVALVGAIVEFMHNSASPQVARSAQITGKRQQVLGGGNAPTRTHYYLTFELSDGSREEFRVNRRDYSLLTEGDRGTLRSQGSWFKGFDRQLSSAG